MARVLSRKSDGLIDVCDTPRSIPSFSLYCSLFSVIFCVRMMQWQVSGKKNLCPTFGEKEHFMSDDASAFTKDRPCRVKKINCLEIRDSLQIDAQSLSKC